MCTHIGDKMNIFRVSTRLIHHQSKSLKSQKIILDKPFHGETRESNFKLITEDLPPLKDGEYLVEAKFLSVDPYMRGYGAFFRPGDTMMGIQVALIMESKNSKFPVGKYVVGMFGWRTHTVANENDRAPFLHMKPYLFPDAKDIPISLSLGALGLTGITAYFGFLELCRPKVGETVVVSTAAGAVGSHVGQIAKIQGCHTIGITGSNEKCEWIKSLGFDHAINYKTQNLKKAVTAAAPKGIDCYFDNVGGEMSDVVMKRMNDFGRISVCGSIVAYDSHRDSVPKVNIPQPVFALKQLKMEGFNAMRWENRWQEAIEQNLQWIREGKLQYKETITDGFENMPQALISLMKGENIGKAIVRV